MISECTPMKRGGGGEEREEKKKVPSAYLLTCSVRPLAGIPYKFQAYPSIKNIWHSIITSKDVTITKVSELEYSTIIFILV